MDDETRLLHIAEKLQSLPFENLNNFQRVFITIWDLEAEVNNGGFMQYFFNSAGENAHEARDSLIAIGAHNCARVVDQAIAALNMPIENWKMLELRRDYVVDAEESMEDEFERLDSLFFAYPDDLSDLMARFVSSHAAEFAI